MVIMPTRRQEKVIRVVKESVSDTIANHLSDPRIGGFISVTRVEITPNLRKCDVYLSIFGQDEVGQKKTFIAITHAKAKIRGLLAGQLSSRFCPVLNFRMDENLKKTVETLNIINKAMADLKEKEQ